MKYNKRIRNGPVTEILEVKFIFGLGSFRCRRALMFFFLFPPLLGLFLFTSTQYSCLRVTKSTAQSTQEAVWQGTRGSFSNIFFLCLLLFFTSRLWSRSEQRERERERRVGWGLISLPPSISNSLCSPHASRGSDLTLPRWKADPLQCFITWWSEPLNVLPELLLHCKHTVRRRRKCFVFCWREVVTYKLICLFKCIHFRRVWSSPSLHAKCHELTFVVNWRCVNTIGLDSTFSNGLKHFLFFKKKKIDMVMYIMV